MTKLQKFLIALGIVLFLSPIYSIFLWSAFDIKWWTEFSDPTDIRGYILVLLHLLSMLGGAFIIDTASRFYRKITRVILPFPIPGAGPES